MTRAGWIWITVCAVAILAFVVAGFISEVADDEPESAAARLANDLNEITPHPNPYTEQKILEEGIEAGALRTCELLSRGHLQEAKVGLDDFMLTDSWSSSDPNDPDGELVDRSTEILASIRGIYCPGAGEEVSVPPGSGTSFEEGDGRCDLLEEELGIGDCA